LSASLISFRLDNYISGFLLSSSSSLIADECGSSVMFYVRSLVIREGGDAVLYFCVVASDDSLLFIIIDGFADFIVTASFTETTIAKGFNTPLKRVLLAIKLAYKLLSKVK
jgi:hypothetical protein